MLGRLIQCFRFKIAGISRLVASGYKVVRVVLFQCHSNYNNRISVIDYNNQAFGGGAARPMPGFYLPTAAPAKDLQSVTRIRSVFPETWLWSSKTTG